ncbi:hypothetical protein [Mollivirus kamchatka]|nr:hypothetical protein [Mollivirus kamchatka]
MFVVCTSKERSWSGPDYFLACTAADVCEMVEETYWYWDGTCCYIYAVDHKGDGKLPGYLDAGDEFVDFLCDNEEHIQRSGGFEKNPVIGPAFDKLRQALEALEKPGAPLPDTTLLLCDSCDSYSWRPSATIKHDPRCHKNDTDNVPPECPKCGSNATVAREWGQ